MKACKKKLYHFIYVSKTSFVRFKLAFVVGKRLHLFLTQGLKTINQRKNKSVKTNKREKEVRVLVNILSNIVKVFSLVHGDDPHTLIVDSTT